MVESVTSSDKKFNARSVSHSQKCNAYHESTTNVNHGSVRSLGKVEHPSMSSFLPLNLEMKD